LSATPRTAVAMDAGRLGSAGNKRIERHGRGGAGVGTSTMMFLSLCGSC
jgi:hypothetical protein